MFPRIGMFIVLAGLSDCGATDAQEYRWTLNKPLLRVVPENFPEVGEHPWLSIKDPSIVHHEGRWHLFCSVRRKKTGQGRIRIGYLSFADWQHAPQAKWHLLELTDDYHGAPQIFYFAPHNKWYLVYQAADESRGIAYGPCYSTTDDISNPNSWTLPAPFYDAKPDNVSGWLDFWVICDDTKAHLFFTSLNGRMWRAETSRTEFPSGWNRPAVVLRGDIFEASHTYRLAGQDGYLSLIEAQAGPRRYYKAFVADRLDGQWKPLAASRDNPFASRINVRQTAGHWTDSISHGELIRAGVNERLEVDPDNLRFLFQGASEGDRSGKDYGSIPWQLGLLVPDKRADKDERR